MINDRGIYFRKVDRRVPVLFGKLDINWFAVDISNCSHLCARQICIFLPLTIILSALRVSTTKNASFPKIGKMTALLYRGPA